MGSEFFAEGGKDVAVKLTPGAGGVLQVYVDGEKIFDKKEEGNKFPDLSRVKQMRAVLRGRLAAATAAADD